MFQKMLLTKPSNEQLTSWFHNLMKTSISETLHKDCEKRINNLKNMIRAVSGNNQMPINDLEYSRIKSF